jgi:hypothetical protein
MEGAKNLVLKKEVRVEDKVLTIELPDEFKGKEVEITVRVKREIEKEILADQIQVDTTKWKFSREELYERF